MLTLKQQRNRKIDVTVKQKKHWLNSTLTYAFAAALGLHLFALAIFHVHAYFNHNETILPPVYVESDMFIQEGVLADTQEDPFKGFALAPPQSKLEFPVLPKLVFLPEIDIAPQNSVSNPFAFLEHDEDYLIKTNKTNVAPQVQIRISGALAEILLIDDGIKAFLGILKEKKQAFHAAYRVQVDAATGKIFWQSPLENDEKLAQQLLALLTFQPNKDAFVTSGEIEISCNL